MDEHQAEVVAAIPEASNVTVEPPPLPAAEDLEYRQVDYTPRELNVPLTIEYLQAQRSEMAMRIELIEQTLGFVTSSADLAIRVARIEAFLGIK